MIKIIISILLIPGIIFGQNYTSYFTGNTNDAITNPQGGICMMGGATEDDNAMKWFLQRADGGDILVLRASGSNGYNDYLYAELGIPVNSVETIVCNNALASNEAYIHQKIQQAEAIWFAGGDQWNYVSYWRNTPIDSLVNQALQQRNIVIGGTSAGMAIQGKYYFSAQYGTVTSSSALSNPFNSSVTVDSGLFIINNYLEDVITDTHFDDPDRRGRLVTFLSRIYTDYGIFGKAIACDEYTAVCIDESGKARVFGEYPNNDDNAYFVQTNCGLADQTPENCSPGNPLTWNLGGQALKVYSVKGISDGSNTFDLNDWQTGTGGNWLHWSANNGIFSEQNGTPIDCTPVSVISPFFDAGFSIYPNPASNNIILTTNNTDVGNCLYRIYNYSGQKMPVSMRDMSGTNLEMDIHTYPAGMYFLQIINHKSRPTNLVFVKQ